ncbi:MAG: DUF5672 family protein [Bacteroidota bacterium]|nr:DUF5672 family protein [Bacteroidota bacterium]
MSRAIVVIPVYRERLTAEEREAVRRIRDILGGHERAAIVPDTMRETPFDAERVPFDKAYFEGTASYSTLLLSDTFYARFERYEYILLHQLDALVFRDELNEWCGKGYDYIGAPVHVDKYNPRSRAVVGNGGFSLRKVESFRRVLSSTRMKDRSSSRFLIDILKEDVPDVPLRSLTSLYHRARILRSVRRGVEAYTRAYSLNEDLFWSLRARLFFPSFKTPPPIEAAEFAIENFPRLWYDTIGKKTPFGCHAWAKWDRGFWEELDSSLKNLRNNGEHGG